jgi:hypothetical protein
VRALDAELEGEDGDGHELAVSGQQSAISTVLR